MKNLTVVLNMLVVLACGALVGIGTVKGGVYLYESLFPANKPIHTPKFKEGDCVAYWMNGHTFKAAESWEKDQVLPAFQALKILKVGNRKYLTNLYYNENRGYKNNSEYINEVDGKYEKVDCSNMFGVLGGAN